MKFIKEASCGHKLVIDHFIIFCWVAYMHVQDPKRKKLDDKVEKCVLLGVSEESKAYHLYNPLTKKFCISKDVLFSEISRWNWENHDKGKSISLELEENGDVEVEKDAHNDWEKLNKFGFVHGSEGAET